MKFLRYDSEVDSWIIDPDSPSVHIYVDDIIRTHDVTAVRLIAASVGADDSLYAKEYTGSARRSPLDSNNPELGALIAFRNALGQLAFEVDKQVEGLIRHQDYVEVDKILKKANKTSK